MISYYTKVDFRVYVMSSKFLSNVNTNGMSTKIES
jgi:hypothetical protein